MVCQRIRFQHTGGLTLPETDFLKKTGTPYPNETDNYTQTHYQLHLNADLTTRWHLQTTLFYTQGGGYYEQYKVQDDFATYGLGFYLAYARQPRGAADK